jgi:hypothetical protein
MGDDDVERKRIDTVMAEVLRALTKKEAPHGDRPIKR